MAKQTLPKWTDERTQQLVTMVGEDTSTVVSVDTVREVAENLETTDKSVASKLRKLGYDVASMAKTKEKVFNPDLEAKLAKFVQDNPGKYTYAEIASFILNDESKARQVQGKLLSMELVGLVKKTPPKEVVKQYTEAEEARFIEMANSGAFLEDIAAALGKTLNSVRGKALSLSRSNGIAIPKQKESHAQVKTDAFSDLGDAVTEMTVAEIAAAIDKTERGVKTMLTHRGITVKDYDGAAKAEKNAAKRDAA